MAFDPHKYWSVHIIPDNDIGLHIPTLLCACTPSVNRHGTIVHHAFDKREYNELAHKIFDDYLNS